MVSTALGRDPATEEEFVKSLYTGGELLTAGKLVEAKEHLERAHQLRPKNEKAKNLLGLAYFKLGLFDRAAEVYELLVRDNPVDPTLRVNLGLVYLKTNNLQRSIKEFETATDLEPGHTKAHNYLGLALAQAGEYSRAREHFIVAGSDAMAEKMKKAIGSAASNEARGAPPPAPISVQLGESGLYREPGTRVAEPLPAASAQATTSFQAPVPSPPAPAPAAPAPAPRPSPAAALEDESIEVMSDDDVMPDEDLPLDAEQVSVDTTPDPHASPPQIARDWGAQFGMESAAPPPGREPAEELRMADDEGPSAVPAPRPSGSDLPVIEASLEEAPAVVEPMDAVVLPERAERPPVEVGYESATPMEPEPAALVEAEAEVEVTAEVEAGAEPIPITELQAPAEAATSSAATGMDAAAALATSEATGADATVLEAEPSEVVEESVSAEEPVSAEESISAEVEVGPTPAVPYAPPPPAPPLPVVAADPAWVSQPLSQVNLRGRAGPALELPEPPAPEEETAPPEESVTVTADEGPAASHDTMIAYPLRAKGETTTDSFDAITNAPEHAPEAVSAAEAAAEAVASEPYQSAPVETTPVAPAEADGTWSATAAPQAEPADAWATGEQAPEPAQGGEWSATQPEPGSATPEAWATGAADTSTPSGGYRDAPPPVEVPASAAGYDSAAEQPAPPPPAPAGELPAGYSPMQSQRLLELGGSSQWVTETTGNPFHVSADGLAITVTGEMLVRLVNLVAVVGSVDVKPEHRRVRGRPTDQPFGAASAQLQRVTGNGVLYLEPGRATFHSVELDEEGAYLREERVFAFEEPIAYENGRLAAEGGLAMELVHLKGLGRVLLQIDGPLKAMPVPPGAPMVVPLQRLVGWYGRVTPRLVGFVGQGAVELTGEGYALLETRAERG